MSPNLNYVFNVKYYEYLKDQKDLKDQKSDSCDSTFIKCNNFIKDAKINNIFLTELNQELNHFITFQLKTHYPGLLVGIGNIHAGGGKDSKNEIKLGFTIDYVSGMPYIPGSTVKGVLRNVFNKALETDDNEYFNYILNVVDKEKDFNWNRKDIEDFSKETFDNGDIFFDAHVISSDDSKVFELDNITPHLSPDSQYNGLTEPIPLTLLKVKGGVEFEFKFKFKEAKPNSDKLKAEQEKAQHLQDNKLKLFKQIIMDLGIGAKTNTGYGFMIET